MSTLTRKHSTTGRDHRVSHCPLTSEVLCKVRFDPFLFRTLNSPTGSPQNGYWSEFYDRYFSRESKMNFLSKSRISRTFERKTFSPQGYF